MGRLGRFGYGVAPRAEPLRIYEDPVVARGSH